MATAKRTVRKKKNKTFSIGDSIRFGWEASKKYSDTFLAVAAINLALLIFRGMLEFFVKNKDYGPSVAFFGLLLIFFVYWPVRLWTSAGLMRMGLKLAGGKGVEFLDLFPPLAPTLKYLAGSFLLCLVVFLGLIFCFVPGIILGIQYQFVPYLMVDKKLSIGEAFELSQKMTAGIKMDLFRFGLNCIGIGLLGLLACCVGVIWATIVVQIAMAFVYRTLLLQTDRRLALRKVA